MVFADCRTLIGDAARWRWHPAGQSVPGRGRL